MNTILPNLLTSNRPISLFRKSLLLLIFISLGNFTMVQAQGVSTNYSFQETTEPGYSNLQSDIKNVLITGAWNDGVVTTVLGMPFTFNGTLYPATSSIYVSANGFISFGSASYAATVTQPISSTVVAGDKGVISGFGAPLGVTAVVTDPLYPAYQANNISKMLTGVVGSRILKIEWRGFRRNFANSDSVMSMQIWLYEGTDVIEIHYDEQLTNWSTSTNGQVGLRGLTTTDYNNRLSTATQDWPSAVMPSTIGTGNGSTIKTITGYKIPTNSNRLFRWTPANCTSPPGVVTISAVLSNSLTATWSAAAPAPTQYDWEIRTSGLPGSGATGLAGSGFVTAPATTVNITGLAGATTYIVYVRSNCGVGGVTSWIASPATTTLCNALPDPAVTPYYQDFEGPVVPVGPFLATTVVPTCSTVINSGAGNLWKTSTLDNMPASQMTDNILSYNGQSPSNPAPANTWFFTQGMQLTAGQTYTLDYLYGGESAPIGVTNKMRVGFGTSPSAAAMTILDDHPSIKTSPLQNILNFTATTTGVYYFGFNCYSAPFNAQMYLDDVQIYGSNCIVPTGVTVPPALVTFSTALVSWTAPSPAPAAGYVYYLSTSSTVPTNGTAFTSSSLSTVLNLSSLSPSTTYYIWVRGNCQFGSYSEWSVGATFTTTPAPPTYCLPVGNATQDPNGILNVTVGSINNSTGTEPNSYGDYSGLSTNVAQGATVNVAITYGTGFTYDTAIWVDWNNNGNFLDAGETVYTGTSLFNNPTTLLASFVVPAGQPLGQRRMRIGGIDDASFTGGALAPCRSGAYQSFEDYTIKVIVAPPALTISSNGTTQCGGTNSPVITITTPLSNFNVYSWAPAAGVTGTAATGYTFNNTSTQTYILTATQTSGAFSSNTVAYTYTANDVPTPITITTPGGTNYCGGGTPIALTASGGVVSNITALSEGFNSGIGSFTMLNTSTPNQAAAAWTSRNSPYSTPGFFGTTVTSNDASPFMFTNSDALGSGTITRTTLTSANIDLTGYSTASLSFYQYFRHFIASDIAQVQVSTNGGGAWTTLASYTSDVGTNTNFAFTVLNLNAYAGQQILIRFNYQANWGWWWAVDNLRVAGSAAPSIVWTGTNIFSDAAGTIPYVAGTGANTVYVRPVGVQSYTATASTPSPTICTATTTISVGGAAVTTYNGTWDNGTPDATKAAVITSNYTSSGNLNACSLSVTGGVVDFVSGDNLILQNGLSVTGGSLTFENTASLIQVNPAVNVGPIVYKRNSTPMRQYDYTYWSSPVSAQVLSNFSPLTMADKYFVFNTALNNFTNVASNASMILGKGYIIRSPQTFTATPQVYFGSFGGAAVGSVPNNGPVTINSVLAGANNFNLIGNPFPSALDADLFLSPTGPNASVISGTIYFWTHNTPINPLQYTNTDYAVYNLSGGLGTAAGGGTGNTTVPTGKIAAGQAFFAEALVNNAPITFNNNMRLIGSNNQFYRLPGVELQQPLEKNRVWLELKNNEGAYRQALVAYIESATDGLDNSFDGANVENGNVVGFYSILGENKLSIQGKGLPFSADDEVPMGYRSDVAGNFEINLSDFDGLFAGQNIYLEDKLLNVIHNLKTGSYPFTTAIGTFEDRFVLRFTDGVSLGIDTPVFTENSVTVFENNDVITVNTSGMAMDNVKIFDVRGRLIAQKNKVNGTVATFAGMNIASGVLIVKITSTDNRVVTKKIVY